MAALEIGVHSPERQIIRSRSSVVQDSPWSSELTAQQPTYLDMIKAALVESGESTFTLDETRWIQAVQKAQQEGDWDPPSPLSDIEIEYSSEGVIRSGQMSFVLPTLSFDTLDMGNSGYTLTEQRRNQIVEEIFPKVAGQWIAMRNLVEAFKEYLVIYPQEETVDIFNSDAA